MSIPFTTPVDPGRWAVTPDEYHADRDCISRGMIDDFITSPQLFLGRYIARTIEREPTPAMVLGHALHMAMDGGAEFVVWPDVLRRFGKKWLEFEAAHAGKTILRRSEFEAVRRMCDSLLDVPFVAQHLTSPKSDHEVAIRWMDDSGLACRCMFDLLHESGAVIDFKTAANPDPEAWVKQAANFGLHRQVAHYSMGYEACFDGSLRWFYVVVGSKPPHDVHILEPTRSIVDYGRMQVRRALGEIHKRLDADDWRLEDHNLINLMSYPDWAYR